MTLASMKKLIYIKSYRMIFLKWLLLLRSEESMEGECARMAFMNHQFNGNQKSFEKILEAYGESDKYRDIAKRFKEEEETRKTELEIKKEHKKSLKHTPKKIILKGEFRLKNNN